VNQIPEDFCLFETPKMKSSRSGLLVLVGHFVNIGAVAGVGVGSGEGVLVKADSMGRITVVGLTPKLGRQKTVKDLKG
jgi:hypothetical protein